uniref:Protein phosphatase 1 regulatory subunit n=1 Tax=Ixodes ricinus TaxID=34613 RepID=V5HR92_IXORI
MPMDLEMVLSANQPLFVGNGSNLSECRLNPCVLQQAPPLFQTCSLRRGYRRASTNVPPIKPCMSPKDEQVQSEPTSPTSPNRAKRRVSFADDKGYSLTQVRVMHEPSDCPPRWTDEFLAQITKDMRLEADAPLWEPSFTQPASDYLEFRQKLETNFISLENVIVKNPNLITGTIKVKNVTFEKHVFVRLTFDSWRTMQDCEASFVPNGHLSNMFDTFAFSVPIPVTADSAGVVEFCVCYRHDGEEHWDSNGGKNYRIVSTAKKNPCAVRRVTEAIKADVHSWTEFASWKNLVTEGPYW